MGLRVRLLFCVLLWALFPAPGRTQPAGLTLGSGVNLFSLPALASSTESYMASALARDTGALFVYEPPAAGGSPRLHIPGTDTPDFALDPGRSQFLSVPAPGRRYLRLPGGSPSELPRAALLLSNGLNAVALPILTGARSMVTAPILAARTASHLVIRTRLHPETGRSEFESYLAAGGHAGFALEAGHGYLVSVRGAARATLFELYSDEDRDGLPDDVQAAGGLTGGAAGDSDGDGLANLGELRLGTDPARVDSDGDGVRDGFELTRGTDPLEPLSRPAAPLITALTPATVTAGEVVTLTLDGRNFTGTESVTLDDPAGTSLGDVRVLSDSRLLATLRAPSLAGEFGLRLVSPAGTGTSPGIVLRVNLPAPSFARDVFPIFGQRCVPCHLPGGSAARPWASPTAAESFAALTQFGVLDREFPSQSRLLLKPSGVLPMAGGIVIFSETSDPDYQTILRWLQAGAVQD